MEFANSTPHTSKLQQTIDRLLGYSAARALEQATNICDEVLAHARAGRLRENFELLALQAILLGEAGNTNALGQLLPKLTSNSARPMFARLLRVLYLGEAPGELA
jgi:hypothetical protein